MKLLGTEFVQNRLGSWPWAFTVDTFMVCRQLPPASPAEQLHWAETLGKTEVFFKTELN